MAKTKRKRKPEEKALRAWKDYNLIPTASLKGYLHAIIKTRRTDWFLCGAHYFVDEKQAAWPSPHSRVRARIYDSPYVLVNCQQCQRKAKRRTFIGPPMPDLSASLDDTVRTMAAMVKQAEQNEKNSLRLVLADYLDDQGNVLGELIRLLVEIEGDRRAGEHPLRYAKLLNEAWRIHEDWINDESNFQIAIPDLQKPGG